MTDNARNRRPLDEAFINAVVILIFAPSSPGGTAAAVNPETRRFWEAVFERAADVQPAEIAEELNRRVEEGTLSVQAFANDPHIRGILEQGEYKVASQASGPTPALPSRGPITPAEALRSTVGGLPTPRGDGSSSPIAARAIRRAVPGTTAGTLSTTVAGAGATLETPGTDENTGQEATSGTTSRIPAPTSGAATAPAEPTTDSSERDEDVFGIFDAGNPATARQWASTRILGSTEPTTRPDLADMTTSHTWRGQTQPPVGIRVLQILNWARDEDVDRRRDFARERREAGAWVDEQLRRGEVGDATRRLLLEARDTLAVHDAFEDYHYHRFANLEVPDPATMPRYRPRLDYREDHPLQLGAWAPGGARAVETVRNRPGRDQHRPYTEVNNLWRTEFENSLNFTPTLGAAQPRHLEALARAENALWARQSTDSEPGAENLAWRESSSFEGCIDVDSHGFEGWTHRVPTADGSLGGARQLWDGYAPQNGAGSFAAERGARRAGLQAGLRQFANTENLNVAEGGATLVLPIEDDDEVLDEEELRRRAGIGNGRPLEILSLPANQMRPTEGKMDPQGFTANMAQFWRIARDRMRDAREAYLWENGPARGPAGTALPLPPDSLFGAYVWRGVNPDTQVQQDMFRQMRGLKRLFDREQIIAPRPLLEEMEDWYQRGYLQDDDPGLVEGRDVEPSSKAVRGLDTIELEWIRFLLNQSMTPNMMHDLQPRTTLFIKFAERLNRIFSDPSDTLFRERDTSVTIEELISHMDKMKGPIHKVSFYPYDVKLWLERLDLQGRCRYTEDFLSYGRVQRPILNYHPESLILWRERTDAEVDPDAYPEDMVYAPRFDDCQTWLDVVAQAPQAPDENVTHYFHCLAYRWGHAMRAGETANAGPWRTQPGLDFKRMQAALDDFEARFRAAIGWDANANAAAATTTTTTRRASKPMGDVENSPLVEVLQRTLNRPWGPNAGTAVERVRTDEALRRIRAGIIDECVRCDSMLFRGRSTDYRDPAARRTRESVWDWARPAVRGPVKRFFGLDRWPLQLQDVEARRRIASGADVDPEQVWDAYTEDPTPWTYWRPKLRRVGEERVRFREGHKTFPIGDTARQKEVVKNGLMAMVGRSMGLLPDGTSPGTAQRRPGLFERFRTMLGLKRRREADEDEDDGSDHVLRAPKLPRVGSYNLEPSYDPIAEAEAAAAEVEALRRAARGPEDEDEDEDEDQTPPPGTGNVTGRRDRRRAAAGQENSLRMEANIPLN